MPKLKAIPAYARLLLGKKRDDRLGFSLLTKLARRVLPTYRLTWPELAWFGDEDLNAVLARFGEDHGLNAHRRYALRELLRLTSDVAGDTAECGVYKGCASYIVLKAGEKSAHPRIHHLFDSFDGLSAPSEEDGSYWQSGDLAIPEEKVKQNLHEFPNIRFHKGWIPDRFNDVADRRFSFVHVDVDLYEPTRDSIRFFYDRLSPGGILVCDDYGFMTCPGATEAIDEFLADKPEKMLGLPGGGGFFIKGCATSQPQ